jgi:hypothetical protein
MNRIGVVFVHGVGSQPPRETLLRWAHALQPVIDARAPDGARGSNLLVATTDRKAQIEYATFAVPPANGTEVCELIVTEAHWAGRVFPPTVAEVTTWLVDQGGFARATAGLGKGRLAQVRLAIPLAALLGVFLLGYSLVRAIVGAIPFASNLRASLIRPFDDFLTQWAGDMWVILNDPIQTADIEATVVRAVRFLRAQACNRVVIVGHSGGAVVSLGAVAELNRTGAPVDQLVTFGEGLNVAWELLDVGPHTPAAVATQRAGDLAMSLSGPRSDSPRRPIWQRSDMKWADFWATDDPVPAGPLRPPSTLGVTATSHEVWNYRNTREDHGGYWDNVEEFAHPLLAILVEGSDGEADRAPDTSPGEATVNGPESLPPAVIRRRQRVLFLALWRRAFFVFLLFTIGTAALATNGSPLDGFGDRLGDMVSGSVVGWLGGPVHWWRYVVADSWPAWWITAAGRAVLWLAVIGGLVASAIPLRIPFPSSSRSEGGASVARFLALIIDFAPSIVAIILGWQVVRNLRDQVTYVTGIGLSGRPITWAVILLVVAFIALGVLVFGAMGVDRLEARLPATSPAHRWLPFAKSWLATARTTVLLLGVLAAVPLIAAALVEDPHLGRVALASLPVIAGFSLVRGIGVARWRSWDASEKRSFLHGEVGRGGLLIGAQGVALLLAAAFMAAALTMGPALVDELGILLLAGAIVLAVVLITTAADTLSNSSLRDVSTPTPPS